MLVWTKVKAVGTPPQIILLLIHYSFQKVCFRIIIQFQRTASVLSRENNAKVLFFSSMEKMFIASLITFIYFQKQTPVALWGDNMSRFGAITYRLIIISNRHINKISSWRGYKLCFGFWQCKKKLHNVVTFDKIQFVCKMARIIWRRRGGRKLWNVHLE